MDDRIVSDCPMAGEHRRNGRPGGTVPARDRLQRQESGRNHRRGPSGHVPALLLAGSCLYGCAGNPQQPGEPALMDGAAAAIDQIAPSTAPQPPERVFPSDATLPGSGGSAKDVVVDKDDVRASQACDQTPPDDEKRVDHTRRRLEELSCTTAAWIDGWFGDDYHIGTARRAAGRLQLSHDWSQYEGNKTRVRLNVRADFPNINEGLSGFFGRDDSDAFLRDRSERFGLRSQFPSLEGDNAWLAGLGYSLPGNRNYRSDLRIGVRGIGPPQLFLQNRIGYIPWSDDDHLLYLRATPFWNTDDGFGFTTGFDLSKVLSDTRLLRWNNVATITEETDSNVDWHSGLIHYQALRKRRAFAYEGFIRGSTEAEVSLREYGVQALFRHPLLNGRLWGEWSLGYSWPKEDPAEEREGSLGLGFGLELPFGERYD